MENIIIKLPFTITDERLTINDFRVISSEIQNEYPWIVNCFNEFEFNGEDAITTFCLEIDDNKLDFDFEKSDFLFYLRSIISYKINTLMN